MKIIFALILSLIAIGIFPFSFQALSTGPGLMFAGMSLVLLVIAYRLIRKNSTATAQLPLAKQSTQSAWWRAGYGFRLSVFLGVIWAVGCYFLQDSYRRDLGLVFWPPIGLVVAYLFYRNFVVGEKLDESKNATDSDKSTDQILDDNRVEKKSDEEESKDILSNQTSRDRERAMNELISRMK